MLANEPRPDYRYADEAVRRLVDECGLAGVIGCLGHLYGTGAIADAVLCRPRPEIPVEWNRLPHEERLRLALLYLVDAVDHCNPEGFPSHRVNVGCTIARDVLRERWPLASCPEPERCAEQGPCPYCNARHWGEGSRSCGPEGG